MEFDNFEDVIKFAIAREEDAVEAYGSMSEKAKSPGIRELLLELQEEEKNHKKLLVELTSQKIASLKPERVIDLKILPGRGTHRPGDEFPGSSHFCR